MVEIIKGMAPDGSGFGSGSGTGSGYGYGYGYGDGSGFSSVSGSIFYWIACIPGFVGRMSGHAQARYADLTAQSVPLAFWRSNDKGMPANGGRGVVASPEAVHETQGPLTLCKEGTLHATRIPPMWAGERLWLVALHGTVVGDDEKLGCLRREIIGECL